MNNQAHRQALGAIELSRTENRPVHVPYTHELAVCLAAEGADVYGDALCYADAEHPDDPAWLVRLDVPDPYEDGDRF